MRWLCVAVLAALCALVRPDGYGGAHSCNRVPYSVQSPKVAGDNGYKIKIGGNPDRYVPGEVYTVILQGWRTHYSVQKFVGFTLVVESANSGIDAVYGTQSVGTFQLYGDVLTMHSDACPNAVVHTSNTPKSEVQVLWTAPPAGSGCVTFKAMVQESRDVWYMDDGELSREVCEEVAEMFDLQQEDVLDCCACDEAKYEVTFEGLWSRQTHPKDFPTNEWLTHFSDIIGASHSDDYRVWEYGGFASDGLRQVAEWGSTRVLESELKRKSAHIRTIIKARGLWAPDVNGKTFAVFRVDNKHHLMSLVSMLGPSPDWIVGVSAMELCLKNCSWLDSKTINLYPWDAGTDSGVTYESANQATIPRERITKITNSYPNNEQSPFFDPRGLPMKPLARLTITRQRVYVKSCSDTSPFPDDLGDLNGNIHYSDEDTYKQVCTQRLEVGPCRGNFPRWHYNMEEQKCVQFGYGGCRGNRNKFMQYKDCRRLCEVSRDQPGEVDLRGHQINSSNLVPDDQHPDAPYAAHRTDQRPRHTGTHTPPRHTGTHTPPRHNYNPYHSTLQPHRPAPSNPSPSTSLRRQRVNCRVTKWTDWSPCSTTCGRGRREKSRTVLVQPSGTGKPCPRKLLKRKVCRNPKCQSLPYGGLESASLTFDAEYKSALEAHGPVSPLEAHGPVSTLEATAPVPNSSPDEAFQREFDGNDNLDCVMGIWSAWSPCTQSCGPDALQQRSRSAVSRARGRGRACGPRLERRYCALPPCTRPHRG